MCYDRTPEFRLAASLASVTAGRGVGRIRTNIEPVVYDNKGNVKWLAGSASVVPHGAPFVKYVTSILQRRMVDATKADADYAPTKGTIPTPLSDLVKMLYGRLDLEKILDLFVPLSFVESGGSLTLWESDVQKRGVALPYAFAALKMLFLEGNFKKKRIPYETSVESFLEAGRLGNALDIAQRRLFASGVGTSMRTGDGRRAAAGVPLDVAGHLPPAMLFPIGKYADELHRAIRGSIDDDDPIDE